MNLRHSFTRTVVLFLALTLFVADLGSVVILKSMLVRSQAQLLHEEAARTIHDLAAHDSLPVAPIASVQSITVYAPDGRVLEAMGLRPPAHLPPVGVALIRGTMWDRQAIAGGRTLVIRSRDHIVDVAVSDLERVLAVISLIMLALGVLAAARSARSLTQPVEALAGEVRRIAETAEIGARVPEDRGPAEVRALSQDMNLMLRTLEQSMRAMEASEQRERALREMAAHDLRNPLSTVLANLELLDRGILPPERARQSLSLARAEAERLRQRVESLLTAPSDGGCDLVEVARHWAGEHPVRAEVDTVTVATPAAEVAEVLGTLLDNASRHNPEGTAVEIAVGSRGASGWLRVRDNGLGMPRDVREHAFDRWYAGDERGGLGLGLALARALVEARGGSVGLTTAPGLGTTVEIRWPLRT